MGKPGRRVRVGTRRQDQALRIDGAATGFNSSEAARNPAARLPPRRSRQERWPIAVSVAFVAAL